MQHHISEPAMFADQEGKSTGWRAESRWSVTESCAPLAMITPRDGQARVVLPGIG
jgi:hypothetical protein